MANSMVLLWAYLALMLWTSQVTSFCCTVQNSTSGLCPDGTKPTPCCATQSCNVFCCNCDGKCRVYKNSLQTPDVNTVDKFRWIDTNGDGMVDEDEALFYINTNRGSTKGFKFDAYDKDANGYLTIEEMDSEPNQAS
ncbi:unnamed protein product [Allacma fusca]|uniref:EF-hand domain-containing protein n=1 Tax=Allacma fusca TaxID=39272 RepID=A0A8J2KJN7_9HEXA|nr:unnamed protein product [Allacma fusca]